MTIGCGERAATRSRADNVDITRTRPDDASRVGRHVIGGIASAVGFFVCAVAVQPHDDGLSAAALFASLAFGLGFLGSLLFLAIVVVAAALRFMLNCRWPHRDWLR